LSKISSAGSDGLREEGAGQGLSQGAPIVANRILSRPEPRDKLAEAVRLRYDPETPPNLPDLHGMFPSRVNHSFFAILVNRAARSGFAPWPPGSPGRFC